MSDDASAAVSVIGSLNIDYFVRVPSFPMPGETVASDELSLSQGGKGANQAIAAARQGCEVNLFGCIGNDEEGSSYRLTLLNEGINLTHLRRVSARTGSAFITVNHQGENTIVVARGANDRLSLKDIKAGRRTIAESDAILGQFETPLEVLVEAASEANRESIPVVINPSPFMPEFPWHLLRTDYLIVNEHEATEFLGFPPLSQEIEDVHQRMHECRIEHLIITRGGDETMVFQKYSDSFSVETLPVIPVDTVGAGDAFAGCFAARIAEGIGLEDAVRAANCAGALCVLGTGAQDPIPNREMVDQHLDHLSVTS